MNRLIVVAIMTISLQGIALAQYYSCITNDFGLCENPGARCLNFDNREGTCHALALTCLCDPSTPPRPEPDREERWDVMAGIILPGVPVFDFAPAGEWNHPVHPWGNISDVLEDPRTLIGSNWCATQLKSIPITHRYGSSWANLMPDQLEVSNTEFCIEFERMAKDGEACDPDGWIKFKVTSTKAEHPGIPIAGLGGMNSGKISTELVEGSGMIHRSGAYTLSIHGKVLAENLPLPSFQAMLDVAGTIENGKFTVERHRVSSATPPTYPGSTPME